jgi:type VII secretion protein EccE
MDPMHNADAVAVRDSVAATLAAATERLAHELQERHLVVRVLPAEEFADVDAAVLAGLQPTRIRRRGRRLKQKERKGPKQFASTF